MDELHNLLTLLKLDWTAIKEKFNIREEHIRKDVSYQKLSGLTEVYNPEYFPGRFFLRNDKVVLIYSSEPDIVENLNGKKIIEHYGEKDKNRLRSRAGKRSNLMVYSEKGFAVSIEGDEVQFIELFQPCSMEQYTKEIYIEVGPFIR